MELGFELIEKLIEYLEAMAPDVWEILVRQVYVDAICQGGLVLLLLALTIGMGALSYWFIKGAYEDDDDPEIVALFFGTITFALLAATFMAFVGVAGRLANPEFYAIRDLLELLQQ